MAILDTDTTNGWVRGACIGSAGYALDANDLLHLGRIVQSISNNYYTPNNATGTMLNYGYHTAISASGSNTGGVFNKGYALAYLNNTASISSINVTIPAGSDFTIRGWLHIDWADQRSIAYFNMENILTTGTKKSLNIGFNYGDLKLFSHAGSATTSPSDELFSASAATSAGYKYIAVTKTGMVLSFYSNGVLIGTYTLPTLASSTILVTPVLARYTPLTAKFMDICVSKVVRNGSFVPSDILGF